VCSPISGYVLRKHQGAGDHVEEGAVLFDVADLSTVWLEAEINGWSRSLRSKSRSFLVVLA
jgi:hypothetical protein